MVEEAAGVRMYESKKESCLRMIDKKENKVQEITRVLFSHYF
jgi:structural maintenance of chromosome 2